jgi:hypothetical protein
LLFRSANDVSRGDIGFGVEHNAVTLVDERGAIGELAGTKLAVAHGILDEVARRLAAPAGTAESAGNTGTKAARTEPRTAARRAGTKAAKAAKAAKVAKVAPRRAARRR